MSEMSKVTLTEIAREVLGNVSLLLVPTGPDDESYDRARAAAVHLAREASCAVVLHDRSDERWTDTPHPEGPYTIDQIENEGREHLVEQMQTFVDAGIDVSAWYSSVPALTAVLTPVQTLGVDGILVPESIDNPKMMDRLQAGDGAGEMVARVLDQNIERPVHIFVLGDDGTIEVITTIDRTDRPD
ncbi:hypothetical protein BH23ACT3_BH23ACT3_18090 [soil metagenome]